MTTPTQQQYQDALDAFKKFQFHVIRCGCGETFNAEFDMLDDKFYPAIRAASPSEWQPIDKEQLMDKIVKIMTDFHGMNHRYAAFAITDLITPPNNHNREGA